MDELLVRWRTAFVPVAISEEPSTPSAQSPSSSSSPASSDSSPPPCYAPTSRRQLAGELGLWVEHNPLHQQSKRKTDMTATLAAVSRPFNDAGFHFLKINRLAEETLHVFDLKVPQQTHHRSSLHHHHQHHEHEHKEEEREVAVTVLVNLYPLVYGHSLLVPRMADKLPQVLDDLHVFHAITKLAGLLGHSCAIAFNSLAAFASVNHLHLHLAPLSELDGSLPIERVAGTPLTFQHHSPPVQSNNNNNNESTDDDNGHVADVASDVCACCCGVVDLEGIDIEFLDDWPAGGYRIICQHEQHEPNFAVACHRLVGWLIGKDVPHSLFCRKVGGRLTAVLFPRPHQDRLDQASPFSLAALELCGLLICKDQQGYRDIDEAQATQVLQSARLPAFRDHTWIAECLSRVLLHQAPSQ